MARAKSQYEQAIEQAGLAVALGSEFDASLEEAAERLIRSADPHTISGTNGEGREIRFDWSFGYDDAPAIAAAAREVLARA